MKIIITDCGCRIAEIDGDNSAVRSCVLAITGAVTDGIGAMLLDEFISDSKKHTVTIDTYQIRKAS